MENSYSIVYRLLVEDYQVNDTGKVLARSLHPIQSDLDIRHVLAGVNRSPRNAILCCRDAQGTLHVVDGHHGWASSCLLNKEVQINIIDCEDVDLLISDLNSSQECEGSKQIKPELDINNPSNDLQVLFKQYGQGLEGMEQELLKQVGNLPKPLANGGKGIPKSGMPQCDYLR